MGVEVCDRHFWDDVGVSEEEKQTDPRLVGTSAIQFILTSNVTLHTLDLMKTAYLNLFSCDDFDSNAIATFCANYFNGTIVTQVEVIRR